MQQPYASDIERRRPLPRNNVGFLRLVLACGVIVGHAPEMIDGTRAREPLTMLFGTVSLGEVCVDAFFLLSGYLITKSALTHTPGEFLKHRILRIAPAFIVAYLISAFILGGVGGGHPWQHIPDTVFRMAVLLPPPDYPGLFPGMPGHTELNGSMWTIAYEFRCYVLVLLLALAGVLRRKGILGTLAVLSLAAFAAIMLPAFRWRAGALDGLPLHEYLIGQTDVAIRFGAIFLMGGWCYICRDMVAAVRRNRWAVAALAAAALASLSVPLLAQPLFVVLGAIPFFWLAFDARLGALARINGSWDVSYGVYLYGWPVAIWLRWIHPNITPWQLAVGAVPLSLVFGAASWWGIEKWCKPGAHRPNVNAAATPSSSSI